MWREFNKIQSKFIEISEKWLQEGAWGAPKWLKLFTLRESRRGHWRLRGSETCWHGCLGHVRRDWKYYKKIKADLDKKIWKTSNRKCRKCSPEFMENHWNSVENPSRKVIWESQIGKITFKRCLGMPKVRPRGSKVAPRKPKGAPRWRQEGPKGGQKSTLGLFWNHFYWKISV